MNWWIEQRDRALKQLEGITCIMGHYRENRRWLCQECQVYKKKIADEWFSDKVDQLSQNERDALEVKYLLTKNL